jgi:hypothetical protein
MKLLAASILLLSASYILLHIYFDWRMEKRIKEYQERIDKWQKKNQ